MANKQNTKLYWFPPKGFSEFFLRSSDDAFKRKHPIGYWLAVVLGIAVFIAPMVVYGECVQSSAVGVVGVAGCLMIGIGLFNLVAIILKQYLGHLISAVAFSIGAILIAIDMGIL